MNRQTIYTKKAWRLAFGVFAALALWLMAAGATAQAAGFAAGPATIVSEDCTNVVVNGVTNVVTGVIDPGEQVQMSFVITNNTGAATTFLFATLQAANNVTAPSAPLAVNGNGQLANGATATVTFTFIASGGCGGSVTPVLSLQDGVTPMGTLTYKTFSLGQSYSSSQVFTGGALTIPASATGNGPAAPYPDSLTVSGVNSGAVSSMALYLNGFTHAAPGDVSVLLVSPTGQKVLAMGGAGGSISVTNFNLKISDAAVNNFSTTAPLTNNIAYKPADLANAAFDNPAPAGPYATSLSTFVGSDVNGSWKLFVFDNHAGINSPVGAMANWVLEFQTAQTVCCLSPNLPQISLVPSQGAYTTSQGVDLNIGVNLSSTFANVSNIVLSASSTNATLFPSGSITFSGAGASRTVKLSPAVNSFGTSLVTITATDSSGLQNSVTFRVDVQFVNQAPTISAISNYATSTNSSATTINFTINDVETPAANLLLFANSSDTSVVPNGNISFGGAGNSRTITIAPGAQGQSTITVSVLDANGGIGSTSFTAQVGGSPFNPSISLSGAVPGGGTNNSGTVVVFNISISDVQTPNAQLVVTASSSNPGLVPNNLIGIAAPGGNTNGSIRTVSITNAPSQFGSTVITLTVTDTDSNTGTLAVPLVYNFVNSSPTITPGSGNVTNTFFEDNAAIIALTVFDAESTAAGVSLSIDSANSTAITGGLVNLSNIGFSGNNGSRILTVLPNANKNGAGSLRVVATDGNSASSFIDLQLVVQAVNDAPTFTKGPDVTVLENAVSTNITGWATAIAPGPGSATDETGQTVSFSVTTSNNGLFSTGPAISSTGALSFTPALNANGSATVTVQAVDSGTNSVPNVNTSASQTFVITVTPINNQPSFSLNTNLYPTLLTTTNITVAEDSGAQTFANLITNITAGAANESGQVLTFSLAMVVTNNANCDASLFATNPVINPANGTLTFAPKQNANGKATLTVTLKDDGGTTNGGVDTSVSVSFDIVITPVADLPTISSIGDATNTVHSVRNNSSTPVSFTVSDPDSCASAQNTIGVTLLNVNNSIIQSVTIGVSTGGNRVLIITPVPNLAGLPVVNAGIQAIVTNATGSATNTFNYIVENVNTPPVIGAIANQTVNDNAGPTAVSFTVDDPGETAPGSIVVTATSSLQANIADANIFVANLGSTNRTIIFTPNVTTASTNVTITVKATDDGTTPGGALPVASSTKQFTVNVNHVNQGPTISGIAKQFTFEGSTTNVNFTVNDFEDVANLTLTATSTNQTLLPNSSLTFGGTNGNRFITITPAPLQFGVSEITITVKDPQNASATTTFQVTVNPINYPPTIVGLTDQTIQQGDTAIVDFTVSDPETTASNLLAVSASSSNGTLLSGGGIVFDNGASFTNGTRRLKLTPDQFQNGTTTVTVTVRDTGVAGPPAVTNQIISVSFVLTVTPINHAPSISPIANQVIAQNTSTLPIPFNVSDGNETAAGQLVVAASVVSSPSSLIQATDIVLAGSGGNRTVKVTPAKNVTGQALITLTVTDAGGLTATSQFTVVVTAVNQPPTISTIANQTTPENTDTALIPFTVADPDTPLNALTITGTSDNQNVAPNVNIFFGGSGSNRAMFITPGLNQHGTANITVSVSDGIAAAVSTTFKLTVTFVNNLPTITSIGNQTTKPGTAITGLKFSVTDVETGSAFLSFDATSSNQQLIPDSNLFKGGSGTNRNLSIFPVANLNGQATITVSVTDADGGKASSQFNVIVGTGATNQPPTIVKNDFNGDGLPDILFQNDDGSLGVWFMNKDQNLVSANFLNPGNVGDLGWRVAATADLNGDGKTDLIFQHTDGSVAAWLMDGINLVSATYLTPDNPGAGWKVVGAGDVNRDHKDDIIFQHTDGSLAVWLMNGTTLTTGTLLNPSSPGDAKWHVVGTGDFTQVGSVDLLFQHDDGSIAVWEMNGIDLVQGTLINPDNSGLEYHIRGTIDLNKDGKTDLLFQHNDGSVAVWFMDGINLLNASLLNPASAGAGWKIVGPK